MIFLRLVGFRSERKSTSVRSNLQTAGPASRHPPPMDRPRTAPCAIFTAESIFARFGPMRLKIGDSASFQKTITADDIERFAELTGDRNPVHLDDDFARRTRFGRRIAHGMLGASLISAALAQELPGPGTIYLSQTLRFEAPVYPGDTITARVEVTGVRQDRPIVTLATTCTNQRGEVVISGEAVVLVEDLERDR